MKTAIILHGLPSKDEFFDANFPSVSNYFWIPWLQKQLAINGIPTHTPEVPNGWIADYPNWKKEFELYEITTDTILIGHSCGAGFIVRWLSENRNHKVNKIILIAPWLDLERTATTDFFNFEIDKELSKRCREIIIVNSDNDAERFQKSVAKLRRSIPQIKYVGLKNRGHFYDDSQKTIPEVLSLCLE